MTKEERNKALAETIIDYASLTLKTLADNDIVEALELLEIQNKIFKAHLGVIASQPINNSTKGGLVPSIKDNGGEIVNLPDGSGITPDDISKNITIGTEKIKEEKE